MFKLPDRSACVKLSGDSVMVGGLKVKLSAAGGEVGGDGAQ